MKYRIVITEEKDDDLTHYANYPEDGTLVKETTIESWLDLRMLLVDYEGLFYQLFKGDERIGAGVFDPDAPFEEIIMAGIECPHDCLKCFYPSKANESNFWRQNEFYPKGCTY